MDPTACLCSHSALQPPPVPAQFLLLPEASLEPSLLLGTVDSPASLLHQPSPQALDQVLGRQWGLQDTRDLPQQMAVILAVLKAAQRTKEGGSWEVPLNTRKILLSPPNLLTVGKFQLPPEIGSSSCPPNPSPQSKNHPPPSPHTPRLSHLSSSQTTSCFRSTTSCPG